MSKANAPKAGRTSDTPDEKPEAVEFREATKILQFPTGCEDRYENHLRLIQQLKQCRAYPELVTVFGLKAFRPGSCWPRVIVVTGPVQQWRELVRVYDTPEAESIVKEEFGGNWGAVNALSNLSSMADPGCSISDLRAFKDLEADIRQGSYIVDRVIHCESWDATVAGTKRYDGVAVENGTSDTPKAGRTSTRRGGFRMISSKKRFDGSSMAMANRWTGRAV